MPSLDIQKTREELRNMYDASHAKKVNFLLYGGVGVGKTTMAVETAPKPVLLHSFDPGGSDSIDPALIASGEVLVDNRYEIEDPKNPKAFALWDQEFHKLVNGGFFSRNGAAWVNSIKTFVLDSATTWASAAMYTVLKRAGRTAGVPQQNDYLPTMTMLENALKVVLSLPCHVVFICHEKADKDEITGKIHGAPLLTGKLTQRIPLMFNEIYHLVTKESSKGTEFLAQTQGDSTFSARTRMGRRGLFDKFERPDIEYLLKKAGKL